jgi:hypothetical protein
MKINPCPNPKCDARNAVTLYWDACGEKASKVRVICQRCETAGPFIRPARQTDHPEVTEAAAIAAWNSITMGWQPGESAPKDGTLIQAVLSDHGEHDPFPAHVRWVDNAANTGWQNHWGERVECYPPHYLIAWRHIPPMPGGK